MKVSSLGGTGGAPPGEHEGMHSLAGIIARDQNGLAGERLAWGGLLKRRSRWGLTARGWLVVLACFLSTAVFMLLTVHPFLSVNRPLGSEFLVVEGWIPEYAISESVDVFKQGNFRMILTVGGPVSGADSPAAIDDTRAYVAATRIKKLGVAPNLVEMVPTQVRLRDRTFGSALAVQEWLRKNSKTPTAITVLTLGVHGRRSRLLYQKAFGRTTDVGIVSIQNREYDPKFWWRSSEGVKEVVAESVGYLYTRFFFWGDGEAEHERV